MSSGDVLTIQRLLARAKMLENRKCQAGNVKHSSDSGWDANDSPVEQIPEHLSHSSLIEPRTMKKRCVLYYLLYMLKLVKVSPNSNPNSVPNCEHKIFGFDWI